MSELRTITFEEGYRRLQQIADEVNRSEVPVDRMADLFAEGKGLDKALTDHLAEQRGRIERIERGEEIHAFRIVAERPEGEAAGNGAVAAGDGAVPAGDGELPF